MKHIVQSLALVGGGLLLSGQVLASGYNFETQSASNQGVANSGAAAVMDSSTIFYNAAGLTQLEGTQVTGVINVDRPHSSFTDTGTKSALGTTPGGGNGGDFNALIAVPHFYLSHQVDDKLHAGLGVFVPFYSHSDYDEGWVGRYQILESKLEAVNINPSVAYKVNDMVSIGGGISAQYFKGTVSKALDLGAASIALVMANPSLPAATKAAVVASIKEKIAANPTIYDGKSEVVGNDWGYGFNLGMLINFTENTRMGLAYRSSVPNTLEGDIKFTVPTTISAILGAGALLQSGFNAALKNTNASLAMDTPGSFSINGYHRINTQWEIVADYTRTMHSKLDELRVKLDGSADNVVVERWRDTSRYSIGTMYRANDKWTWRAGIAYDQSPEDNALERTASIPDSNRTWFSMGVRYVLDRNNSIDVAGTFVKSVGSSINRSPLNASEKGNGTVVGDFDVRAYVLGLQYNYRF